MWGGGAEILPPGGLVVAHSLFSSFPFLPRDIPASLTAGAGMPFLWPPLFLCGWHLLTVLTGSVAQAVSPVLVPLLSQKARAGYENSCGRSCSDLGLLLWSQEQTLQSLIALTQKCTLHSARSSLAPLGQCRPSATSPKTAILYRINYLPWELAQS